MFLNENELTMIPSTGLCFVSSGWMSESWPNLYIDTAFVDSKRV